MSNNSQTIPEDIMDAAELVASRINYVITDPAAVRMDIAEAIFEECQKWSAELQGIVDPKWRTMKSAPKDGTKILLSCPAARGYPGVVQKSFWCARSRKWWDWVSPDKPTHWQPLPSAVKGEA